MSDPGPVLHALYGVHLAAPVRLPGLRLVRRDLPVAARPELELRFARGPLSVSPEESALIHRSEEREAGGAPVVEVRAGPNGAVDFIYGEGVRFRVHPDLKVIETEWDAPLELDDMVSFLVGPVLGFVLRRRGTLALHAGASVLDGRAVGFVGPGGAGKSTLVAALARRGHAALTDDLLALEQQGEVWLAQPGPTRLRLWDDSAAMLLGTAHGLPALSPNWEKRLVSGDDPRFAFHADGLPLRALVLLGAPPHRGAAGAEGLLFLVAHSSAGTFIGPQERASELAALGRLVRDVPLLTLEEDAGADPSERARRIERIVAEA